MTVEITLTSTGTDISTLDIYSDSDGFTTPVSSNVPVAFLIQGTEFTIPDNSTSVRVQALGDCVNYIDINLT